MVRVTQGKLARPCHSPFMEVIYSQNYIVWFAITPSPFLVVPVALAPNERRGDAGTSPGRGCLRRRAWPGGFANKCMTRCIQVYQHKKKPQGNLTRRSKSAVPSLVVFLLTLVYSRQGCHRPMSFNTSRDSWVYKMCDRRIA